MILTDIVLDNVAKVVPHHRLRNKRVKTRFRCSSKQYKSRLIIRAKKRKLIKMKILLLSTLARRTRSKQRQNPTTLKQIRFKMTSIMP